jgi:hypothetical protein
MQSYNFNYLEQIIEYKCEVENKTNLKTKNCSKKKFV